MTAGEGWCLAAAGVLLALLVLKFPTFGRYVDTIESALKQHEEGAMGRGMLK